MSKTNLAVSIETTEEIKHILYEVAKQEGMEQTLINQIIAKLNKGMDIPAIAEMLETEEDYIKELIEKHELMAVKS